METQTIINKTEKSNSYEFGKASNRHKIYYDTPDELLSHINKLKELGFNIEDEKESKD